MDTSIRAHITRQAGNDKAFRLGLNRKHADLNQRAQSSWIDDLGTWLLNCLRCHGMDPSVTPLSTFSMETAQQCCHIGVR